MGEILELLKVQVKVRNEHDRRAVRLLYMWSGTIVGHVSTEFSSSSLVMMDEYLVK